MAGRQEPVRFDSERPRWNHILWWVRAEARMSRSNPLDSPRNLLRRNRMHVPHPWKVWGGLTENCRDRGGRTRTFCCCAFCVPYPRECTTSVCSLRSQSNIADFRHGKTKFKVEGQLHGICADLARPSLRTGSKSYPMI